MDRERPPRYPSGMAGLFVHEDDWGMISLVPAENRADRAAVVEAAAAHGVAHQLPDGQGWTAMYIAPSPPTEIGARKITLEALVAVLGGSWQPVAGLVTGYGSTCREDVEGGYACQLTGGPVLYGRIVDGVVSKLHVTDHITPAAADSLHHLGRAFDLILCDLWRDVVVELADRSAVEAYCADE
jgi:hypothetical protein